MDYPKQSGALSQERLFDHLERNGYYRLFHTPSIFRNHNGTVRFSLVVDDFAVVWSNKTDMNHFIKTLRQLYKKSKLTGMVANTSA
jgi:hypothetical protein